jgi:hypothetical protein
MNPIIRVEIKPELLSWARERAGYDITALAHRFPKLAASLSASDNGICRTTVLMMTFVQFGSPQWTLFATFS